jgi:hypothetical protein
MSRVPAATPTPVRGSFNHVQEHIDFRSIVTRCLAAAVLLGIYCAGIVGTSALLLAASSTTADARGGGGRGGGFRGGGFRGRGRGWGWGGYVEPGCYYNYRWGRVICPY